MPSAQDKLRWKEIAKKANLSLSNYIVSVVETAMANEAEATPRSQLVKELGGLKKEIKRLNEDLKQKSIVIEKYDADLKHYKNKGFLKQDFQGTREYDPELLSILKKEIVVDSYRLLEELGIDPKDSETVKVVTRQLEELEAYGLIASKHHGWRWVG